MISGRIFELAAKLQADRNAKLKKIKQLQEFVARANASKSKQQLRSNAWIRLNFEELFHLVGSTDDNFGRTEIGKRSLMKRRTKTNDSRCSSCHW